ncbi:YcaO-like family protein [Marinobacterium sp. D7]|uniref:30S ribosomal protein S12 methylthiotransferase accessory factor YcaO n=1 Tax=Marinobacterium ramblicola TaxID=2849041 RepID=UPI001C2CFD0F|nr:30S ribosomal protein S12 methylthiotransferase accessory factor YcaO [Marinobacterium ramblicola]MBV1788495.1 YcaO-like family protein [Marinobacterium ramblicola]
MTRISGKDLPLEESIECMSKGLKALGFDIEEVRWLNPVPSVWSVQVRDRNCPMLYANGQGSIQEAALASALGEFYERLGTNYFFTDYYLGKEHAAADFVHYPNERWFDPVVGRWPDGLLDDVTRDHYDLHDELNPAELIDLNSSRADRGICALPFIRQRTGDEVWFPVNIIGNLYASNGMAAGNNKWEARVQALSEIFERHIKSTIISTGISLPPIPVAVLRRYPKIQAGIKALRARGFVVEVRDASLGGKFPLVNVTLINPEDGGCYASFGAHPKFEVALERALTELLQGRELDQLGAFPSPTFNVDEAASPLNLETHFSDSSGVIAWDLLSDNSDYPFTEWNIDGDRQEEFNELCHRIHRVDMDIYIADYEHLGIYTCRIIVPGMSEIYPVDKLIWRNNNAAIDLRASVLALAELEQDDHEELLDALVAGRFDDDQQVAALLGVVPDEGGIWETLSVGELRCLLLLATGDKEGALDCVETVLESARLPRERRSLYRCLHTLLNIELDPLRSLESYRALLIRVYGEVLMDRAVAMLEGRELFTEFVSSSELLENFKSHQTLIGVYSRLQLAKTGN